MSKPVDFLLVEDNPGDIRLIEEFFKDLKLLNRLSVVNCWVGATQYVQQQEPYASATLPDIMLISVAILWQNTGSLFNLFKDDMRLAQIPMVALTAFEGEEEGLDINLSISLSVCKPLNLDRLMSIIRSIEDYAFTIAKSV